jgi:hypothetical protein
MLMRKWIIDDKGHLAGIWNDWNQPRTVPVYLTESRNREQPTAPGGGSREFPPRLQIRWCRLADPGKLMLFGGLLDRTMCKTVKGGSYVPGHRAALNFRSLPD